jgi:hypothetical protein
VQLLPEFSVLNKEKSFNIKTGGHKMTLENYNYRTSPLFLRNNFAGTGEWQIPIIPKAEFDDSEFENLRLIGIDKTKDDTTHYERMVHFFLYDYKFNKIWDNPEPYIEHLKNYKAVLTPDFSMYVEMNPVIQLYNTFRNRYVGAYLAEKGLRVVPAVNWGNENTFDFCFEGIPKGSVVAVSTYMVSEHNNHSEQKEFFLKGYNEMFRRIEPEKIICYHKPFDEMQGDIVFVDYDLSNWQHMDDDKEEFVPSKAYDYIIGKKPLPKNSELVIKYGGYVTNTENSEMVVKYGYVTKGSGSAFGGDWRPSPNKPEDRRFLGEPDSVKRTVSEPNKYGDTYERETKIGPDGRAVMERHHSTHPPKGDHSDPHDHMITWEKGTPYFGRPIQYYDVDAPEFKNYITKENNMKVIYEKYDRTNEDLSFHTIADFKFAVGCGAEIIFSWSGMAWFIASVIDKPGEDPDELYMYICEYCYEKNGKYYNSENHALCDENNNKYYKTVDELLEHTVNGDRLRDVITKVEVVERTI